METLLATSVIFLFLATTASVAAIVYLVSLHKQSIHKCRKLHDKAEQTLADCKALIAQVQEAHNSLTKLSAENQRQLQDIKFAVEMNQRVRK